MNATVQRMESEDLPAVLARPGWLRWLCWFGFLVGWTIALLTPQPVDLAKRMLPDEALFSSFKLAHVTCYAIMVLLSTWLPVGTRGRWLLLGFLSSHAFLTEFFQQFVPGRTASLFDVAVDHLGILIGIASTWKWWRGPQP